MTAFWVLLSVLHATIVDLENEGFGPQVRNLND